MAHPIEPPLRSRSIRSSQADDQPPRYSFENGRETLHLGFRGSTDLSPIDSRDEEDESFGPIGWRTWGKQQHQHQLPPPPSFLLNGTLLPAARRPVPQQPRAILRREISQPPPKEDVVAKVDMLAPDCDQFLKMMDEKLRVEERRRAQGTDSEHVRSTSSSYPSQGNASFRVQSPADSITRRNKLSPIDLSRFSSANHRLSILRSSSSTSGPRDSRGSSSHEVLAESSSVISQWQKELRQRPSSYLQYELAESAEVLPSDSLSQQKTPSSYQNSPYRPADSPSLAWGGHRAIRAQYDGAHEGAHSPLRPDPHESSPSPFAVPTCAEDDPKHQQHSNKRKASYFSLRSLSIVSLTKRPRTGLRKWANTVYRQGSTRLRQARRKFREHAELDRRAFEAWRERRRRSAAGTPSLPRSRPATPFAEQKSEDWWKDGVNRFEAPKWMLFRAGSVLSLRR